MAQSPSPVFFNSDLSQTTLDYFGGVTWEFLHHLGANCLAHVALGTIVASAALWCVDRGHRHAVIIVLFAAIIVKDFSLDFMKYAREPLVFLDIFIDAACYFLGWKLVDANERLVADRARRAGLLIAKTIGMRS